MSALQALTDEEAYLWALLSDQTGVDLAEFLWTDEAAEDRCYRLWDFQWPFFQCEEIYQVDLLARGLGKSLSIVMRALTFPFDNPSEDMLITAPQLKHLKLITDNIEKNLDNCRLYREMLPAGRKNGIAYAPSFQIKFLNGSKVMTRLPGIDGKGLKGPHPVKIEMDECFPAGTLVTTNRGQISIETVASGDQVLTHAGRWQPVEKVFDRGVRQAVKTAGHGHPGLVSTPDHPFYGREVLDYYNRRNRHGIKELADPTWTAASGMEGRLWATPSTVPPCALEPDWIIPKAPVGASYKVDASTEVFAWTLGLFLAEGSLSSSYGRGGKLNRSYFSVHVDEVPEVLRRLDLAGLKARIVPVQSSDKCINVLVTHEGLAAWFAANVNRGARNKQIPAWVLSQDEGYRRAVLEGLIYGDGCAAEGGATGERWKLTTASKGMAVSARLLATGLGYSVSCYYNKSRPTSIRGREVVGSGWFQVVGRVVGQSLVDGSHSWSKVRSVEPAPDVQMYDLQVRTDHSFVADGIVVHNSQDIATAAYMEIIETIKINAAHAMWRVHGVSNGTRDMHYRLTHGEGLELPFYVHHYIAAHRPDWNDEERKNKLAIYGGDENHPDYVRNIFGEPSDLGNAIFVTARLLACTSMQQTPADIEYNDEIYTCLRISQEQIDRAGGIEDLLAFNFVHLADIYSGYWAGMDVGFTNDPSEILVFGTLKATAVDRLLLRVHLERVTAPQQVCAIVKIFEFFGVKLRRFGMDRTGNGLPLWQYLMNDRTIASRIAGYNFSEKRPVEFDDRPPVGKEKPEDLVIVKWIKDHATDMLRKRVDTKTIQLPYDNSLLIEWQGQSVSHTKLAHSQDGAIRKYSGGECLPGDAEVLTDFGWVRFDKYVENPVRVAQWRDGELEMVMPTAIVQKPYSGSLVRYTNANLFYSMTTPEHLLPGVRRGRMQFKPAGEASFDKMHVWPRNGILDGPGTGRTLDEIALEIAVSADGCIQVDNRSSARKAEVSREARDGWRAIEDLRSEGFTYEQVGDRLGLTKVQVRGRIQAMRKAQKCLMPIVQQRRWCTFGLSKQRKIDRTVGILDRLGVVYSLTRSGPDAMTYIRFDMSGGKNGERLSWLGKRLPCAWISLATLVEREFILAELEHWDGHRGAGMKRSVFSTTIYDHAVWAQTMSHTAGRMATIIKAPGQYQVTLQRRSLGSYWGSLAREDVPFEGDVYCVDVPSEMFLVRQQGCISMIHNCHSLDAARMYALAKDLMGIEALLDRSKASGPVLDRFF